MDRRAFLVVTAAAGACSTRLAAQSGTVLHPEDFGARGDGVTSDAPAFAALSAEINGRGGKRKDDLKSDGDHRNQAPRYHARGTAETGETRSGNRAIARANLASVGVDCGGARPGNPCDGDKGPWVRQQGGTRWSAI